jgi:hypothetical protein
LPPHSRRFSSDRQLHLRSGRSATEYFDKYRFEADPALLDEIAAAMVSLVPPGTEVLAGLEMGGIPVVTALGRHTGLPWAFDPASAVRALRGLLRDDAGEGAYCVPDEWVTAAVDVRPWPARKWAAVLAHRSEVERGAAPGRLAALPPDVRDQVLATEWYIRHPGGPGTGPRSAPDGELTV